MTASDSPTTVQQLRCLFLDFASQAAFDFDQKLLWNVVQMILYYHVTKQFLPFLIWLVTYFWFQNMICKSINYFRFWWKTYIKRCTSNYVITRVKRLSSPVLRCWSSAFNFWVWFGKRNIAVKIPILIFSAFAYFADFKTIYLGSCLCCSVRLF